MDERPRVERDGYVLEVNYAKPLNIQVCTDAPESMVEEMANEAYECGTTTGWIISRRTEQGVVCEAMWNRRHYLMDC